MELDQEAPGYGMQPTENGVAFTRRGFRIEVLTKGRPEFEAREAVRFMRYRFMRETLHPLTDEKSMLEYSS